MTNQTFQWVATFLFSVGCFGLCILFNRLQKTLAKTQRELAELQFKHNAVVERVDLDHLTNVYSRGAGERRMQEALRCFPCVVVFLDLDDFGLVNKAHGWAEGDRLLKDITSWLRARFRRAHDTIYRYGGDEFVIVLPAIDVQPDSLAADQPLRTDPLNKVMQHADQMLREIFEGSAVRFTFGLATTRQYPIHRVLIEAQEEARLAKQRRKDLQAAEREANEELNEVHA